jgi:hypothetical protein
MGEKDINPHRAGGYLMRVMQVSERFACRVTGSRWVLNPCRCDCSGRLEIS